MVHGCDAFSYFFHVDDVAALVVVPVYNCDIIWPFSLHRTHR